jgi:hypothetical protein
MWAARVEDYLASGLSIREWCVKNQCTHGDLRYWLKEMQIRTESPGKWAEVEVVEDVASSERTCTSSGSITLWVGAARIEVQPGFDPAFLSEVLKAVAAVC